MLRIWLRSSLRSRLACGALLLVWAGLLLPVPPARAADDGEALYRRVRETWRTRTEAPFVRYGVRVRYEDAGRIVDTWYQVTYRASDGAIEVERVPLPGDETRLRGFTLQIFGGTVFDSNPSAQVYADLRRPAIEPGYTFGLMPTAFRSPVLPEPDASAGPDQAELREIGRVVAVNREYRVTLVGTDQLRYGEAYHLALTPIRDPGHARLRDVWLAKDGYNLLQLRVAGILDVRPYDTASWTVTYVPLAGRMYIQQVRTDDSLRFGERRVHHFTLDFVDYRFPNSLPPRTFEHW